MKLAIIATVVLLQSITAYAKEPSLSEVLEWKYGPIADTKQVDESDWTSANPKMYISTWRHKTLPKPSITQMALDTEEYKDYLVEKESSDTTRKAELKLRLKLSEADIATIKEILS